MKKKGLRKSGRFHVSNLVIVGTFLLFLVLIGRLCYLCIADYKVGDSTITAFIKIVWDFFIRHMKGQILKAMRDL